MGIYFKDGKILLDGSKFRGCCCQPPPSCLSATANWYYYFYSPAGSNLHSLGGSHHISAGNGTGTMVANDSDSWFGGTWESCSQSTTKYFQTGDCPNTGCPNGTAKILLNLTGAQTLALAFTDSRTFQESWSSALYAEIEVVSIGSNTKLVVGNTTITSAGTYRLGTYTKTNSNSVSDTFSLQIAAR